MEAKEARDLIQSKARAAIAALQDFERAVRETAEVPIGEDMALDVHASTSVVVETLRVLEARFGAMPELTSERVLHAMLKAYVEAAMASEQAFFTSAAASAEELMASEDRDLYWDAAEAIRGELASFIVNGGVFSRRLEWPKWVDDDYRARMSGERKIDASPREAL